LLINTLKHKKTQALEMSFNDRAFLRDGKNYFILSGEMHYFRIDAKLWPVHLKQMKDAGLNTVSSYIPWSLHEQTEGQPDFSGRYGPNLDLERFIGLCKDMQLNLTVKPGPYILAELVMHGIPRWFFENYPDALACDVDGKPYPVKYTCLIHPDYKRKAMQWYDAVMPLLASNQISNGGPIALMQVCNEAGLFQWLGGAGDYSETSLQDYRSYLFSSYGNIEKLNAQYGTKYIDWSQINPPSGHVTSKEDHFGYQDWQTYHRCFYANYIGWLIGKIRDRGIETPLFHNVPGWVFTRAKDMPVCLSMYHELSRLYPDIILGIDHIPENPSYRNFHDDRIINEFTKAMQGGRGPMYVAELQAGTREANVRVYPAEMELFYKACLANGIVSMNYYMFSQGQNPPGWSIYDSSFYLQTPLDINGKPGDSYPVVQHIGKLIKTHGSRLCDGTTNASQALVFYPPYYYRELTSPLFTKENFDPQTGADSRFDKKTITEELLFDSVGKLLAMDNQEYDAVDITHKNTEQLKQYKQLWLASTDRMDAESQKTLLKYVKDGGHLICFPTLPKFDLQANPCTLLADGLKVQTDQVLDDFDGMICWADTKKEIHATRYIETFKAENAKTIAKTQNGKSCGLKVICGKGSATVFGTGFIYQAADHRTAWQKLGLAEDFRANILCDNPLVITRTRMVEENSGYFFMLNYHNQSQKTKVESDTGLFADANFYLPPSSGLVLPFNLPLGNDCDLIFATSEILTIESSPKKLTLEISGHTKTDGQIVLECNHAVNNISLNGKDVPFEKRERKTILQYQHSSVPETLVITFS
jgi:beta-galactosidase GanA